MSMTPVKHQPATPLPWGSEIDAMIAKCDAAVLKSEYRKATDEIAGFVQGHRDYIVHAANAYPKLVEALRYILAHPDDKAQRERGANLLRELGEAE